MFTPRRNRARGLIMPIYIRCPHCKSDQSIKNKRCKRCGNALPKQAKTYRVMVRYAGKTVTKVIPHSLELAKEIESKIKVELVEGSYFDRRKRMPTLDEVWQKYLEVYEASKGREKDRSRYNTMLKERFGNKALDKIGVMDIQRLVVDMRKTVNMRGVPYSAKSIKNVVELLSRLFNFAIKQDLWHGDNPCKKVKLPKVNNEVTNALDTEQINNLLKVLDGYPDRETANLVKLLLFTGIRRGEAFKLQWGDVDLDHGWLYLRNPKGGKDQVIPLNDLSLQVLKDQLAYKREETALVFPSRKNTMRTDIKRAWARIKRMANLPDNFRLHDLRHTYATILASSGQVDLYTLQRLLTHKSPLMTQRYAHLVEDVLKRGTQTLVAVLKKERGKVISLRRGL